MVKYVEQTDQLSLTFGALADPTRRAILGRLSKGEASVTELAEPYKMSMSAITKHLKVLEKAGYEFEGRLRKSAIKDGKFCDQLLYAKIK